MYLEAYVLYTTALLLVGVIISLAPIFLCFLLFKTTKSLYENWLKKLLVYSFQPVILFASLAFLGGMVRTEVYSSLGFKVCQMPIIDLPIMQGPLLSLYYPQPQSAGGFSASPFEEIAVPISKTIYNSNNTTQFFPAYTYQEKRYLDMPFIDPNTDEGKEKINRLKTNGLTVDFVGLAYLILITMILFKFNSSTLGIANTIFGGGGKALDPVMKSFTEYQNKAVKYLSKKGGEALNRNSLFRTMSSVRKVVGSGAGYYAQKISNKLHGQIINTFSRGKEEDFVKNHGWLAKKLGAGDSSERALKEQKLQGKFNASLIGLQKNSLEFGAHRLNEAKWTAGAIAAAPGKFANAAVSGGIYARKFGGGALKAGEYIARPLVNLVMGRKAEMREKKAFSAYIRDGATSLWQGSKAFAANLPSMAQKSIVRQTVRMGKALKQKSEDIGQFSSSILNQVNEAATKQNIYNGFIAGLQKMVDDKAYDQLRRDEERLQKKEEKETKSDEEQEKLEAWKESRKR
jgi:hypothetical protein